MPPPRTSNSLGGPSVAERIKRNQMLIKHHNHQLKKKSIKTLMGGTTQGIVKMRRESYTTTPGTDSTKTVNGKVNTSTKK